MIVHLETAEGELVGSFDITMFMMMPEVLVWGDRMFRLRDFSVGSMKPHIFREIFAYHITEQPLEAEAKQECVVDSTGDCESCQ